MNTVELTYYILLHGNTKVKVSVSQNFISVLEQMHLLPSHLSFIHTMFYTYISECHMKKIILTIPYSQKLYQNTRMAVWYYSSRHIMHALQPQKLMCQKIQCNFRGKKDYLRQDVPAGDQSVRWGPAPCSYTSPFQKSFSLPVHDA